MSYLNGRLSPAIIAGPHFVQLNVPERGFGTELDAMVQFCLDHGEEFRISGFRQVDRRDCVLFCFRDPGNAAEFARRFGGDALAAPSDDDLFLQ